MSPQEIRAVHGAGFLCQLQIGPNPAEIRSFLNSQLQTIGPAFGGDVWQIWASAGASAPALGRPPAAIPSLGTPGKIAGAALEGALGALCEPLRRLRSALSRRH